MDKESTVVIVGAGPAGGQAALSLRENGYSGRVILIGEESYLPYERPPLSKGVLLSEESAIPLLPGAGSIAEKGIEHLACINVEKLNAGDKVLSLSDGSELPFDKLLLATGARLRRLDIPGGDKKNIHYLRTYDDALKIKSQLKPGAKLVVIGGGFIGLETAASARKLGCEVSVVEAAPQLMGRVVPPCISNYFTEVHKKQGIDLHIGVLPESFDGGAEVSGVTLVNGKRLEADLVLVGIGVIPNTDLAEQAGLGIDNGILVDEYCRTSNPDIYAVGDVTNHYNPLLGKRYRHESWQNAINQAAVAAAVMCDSEARHAEVPWVWTDQFDVNMQMAGVAGEYDRDVIRGDLSQDNFTVFQMSGNRVVGAITVNRGAEMSVAKRFVGTEREFTDDELSDDSIKLRKLLKR